MFTDSDSHHEDNLIRSHVSPGLKHSIIISKGTPQVLNFASKSQANLNISTKKDVMTKSFMKRDSA